MRSPLRITRRPRKCSSSEAFGGCGGSLWTRRILGIHRIQLPRPGLRQLAPSRGQKTQSSQGGALSLTPQRFAGSESPSGIRPLMEP